MKYKKASALTVLLLLVLHVAAAADIVVHFTLYRGLRDKNTTQPAVAASHYLKPLDKKSLIPNAGQSREKAKLKRIYNLKEAKLLLKAKWGWQKGTTGTRSREVLLNKQKYRVDLTVKKRTDGFHLEVRETVRQKSNTILDTEITLPEDNRAIFGFEDSAGNIYFLSFYRETGAERGNSLSLSPREVPAPVHRVDPVYPPDAVENNIEGTVIIQLTVDEKGNVSQYKIVSGGHKLLNNAAVDAVKQWKYAPYVKEGQPQPVRFSVVLDFFFD